MLPAVLTGSWKAGQGQGHAAALFCSAVATRPSAGLRLQQQRLKAEAAPSKLFKGLPA